MTIELIHNIVLQHGFAFLELEVLHEASDMAEFLEACSNNKELYKQPLQKRAKKEMKKLGFLDAEYNITNKGRELIESKKRYIKECGKYEIHFITKDKIFGNRIFMAERANVAEKEINLNEVEFKGNYFLLKDNEARDKIIINKVSIEKSINKNDKTIRYTRIYEINSVGEQISDKETINDKKHSNKEPFLDIETFTQKYQEMLRSNWNDEKLYYRVDIEEIDSFIEKQNIADIRTFKASFERDIFNFKDILLAPKEKQDAQYFLNLCLLKDLEESYNTNDELETKINSYINNHLKDFLDITEKEQYINNLESKLRSRENKNAYWHYHAINDLAPQKDFKPQPKRHITLEYDEEESYSNIIHKIKQDREIKAFIYIDKYFTNDYQYKRAQLIIQGFNAARSFIITDERNQEALEKMGLQVTSFTNMPHDRYFILKLNDTIELWSITQSDFLYFDSKIDSITLDTKGRAKGCTISNLDNKLSILSNELQDFIKNIGV